VTVCALLTAQLVGSAFALARAISDDPVHGWPAVGPRVASRVEQPLNRMPMIAVLSARARARDARAPARAAPRAARPPAATARRSSRPRASTLTRCSSARACARPASRAPAPLARQACWSC
jgi:hypothetical protein